MRRDGEMQLLHYYVQLGWRAEDFAALDGYSKAFYRASMDVALEDRKKMFGHGKG